VIQYLVEEALRAVALENDARARDADHKKQAVAGAKARAEAALERMRRAGGV